MKKKYNAIFVGRLSKEKGLETVLETAEYCSKKISNFKLAIVGSGDMEEWLKEEVKKKKLSKVVLFLGYKSNPRKYIAQAHVLILPSYNEGMPMVVLESYAEKVPVVVTPYEGADEVVLHKRTGIIVKRKFFPNEVFNLLKSLKKRELMGQYGNIFARKYFSPNNIKVFIDTVLE
jgi:glycosyltransferase involved in cell wall biosynthesis